MDAETPVWSEEDLRDMAKYTCEYLGHADIYGHSSANGLYDNYKVYSSTKKLNFYLHGLRDVFQRPLSDMLLYINWDHPWVRAVAAWRFENGR